MLACASFASSKPNIELYSNADTCIVGDSCLVIHDHKRPINVYSCDPKDGHESAMTVNATVYYWEPQSEKKYNLIINIQINSLENPLSCSMQHCLHDVHISEVSKLLADSPSVTSHAIQLLNLFDAAYSLTIPLK